MKQISKNIKVGDNFCIPAISKDGEFGLVIGRNIEHIDPNVGYLIEVFSKFYIKPPMAADDIDRSTRLFRPILCSFRFSEIPRWRIIMSDAKYNKSESDFANISIAFDTKKWVGGRLLDATRSEMTVLEPSVCWRTHHVVFRVNSHLANMFEPNENYVYHKLPPELRVDSTEEKAKVVAAAELLDSSIKDLNTIGDQPKSRQRIG